MLVRYIKLGVMCSYFFVNITMRAALFRTSCRRFKPAQGFAINTKATRESLQKNLVIHSVKWHQHIQQFQLIC